MKLLIVDDEVFAIDGIMNGVNWDALDFEDVLRANSYTQAVEIFNKQPVDVLLCDIEMPNESGLELIQWVNTYSPDTACIILSCHDEFDFAQQAVQLNCMDYVLKPARYDFLTEVLHKAGLAVSEKGRQLMLENYGKLYIDNMTGRHPEDDVRDIVEKVSAYIDEHLTETLSVETLANMAYVSTDHLTRSFKKRYKQTVSDYILQKRMLLAGELLREPHMTVTIASDKVGFGNYSYFTKQFKKVYGITPREYQLKQRLEDNG